MRATFLRMIALTAFVGSASLAAQQAGTGQVTSQDILDGLKDPCAAYRSLNQAYALDRYNPVIAVDGGALDVARARARKAGCG